MEAIVKDSTATAMSTAAATTGDDATATKQYKRLSALGSKAMAGKGVWYWAHLKPVMVPADAGSALPASAKLQCELCSALFSASNPSRTAHEHLKPGICPNLSSAAAIADPLPNSSHPIRKRELLLLFSGGEEDLAALATLEDSVKMLKSPVTTPVAVLSRPQAEKALALLPDWIFESGGAVSFSALRHSKFQAFLHPINSLVAMNIPEIVDDGNNQLMLNCLSTASTVGLCSGASLIQTSAIPADVAASLPE